MTEKLNQRLSILQRGLIISGDRVGGPPGYGAVGAELVAQNGAYPNESVTRFIQINLQKSKQASVLLTKNLNDTKIPIDIALITEPNSFNNNHIKCNGFDTIQSKSTEPARSCIMIRRKFNYLNLPQFSTRDSTAILVETKEGQNSGQLIIASIYMEPDPSGKPPSKAMQDIVNYSKQKQIPLIIGSDCNSHHPAWGSKDINTRGASLADYIATENLAIHNVGSKPTFKMNNKQSVIDITLTSGNNA